MTLQEVANLAKQGEGLHIEFKKKVAHPDKIIKEVIALANTEGGYLLIGVDDDGTVSGQRYVDEDVFLLDKTISESVKPKLFYEKFILPINAKKGVAVFKFEKSPSRPHYFLEEKKRRSFIRVKDRSVQASREVWEILKKQKKEQDVFFQYGEKEDVLMKALKEQESITLKQFAKLAKLPRFAASRILVRMVLANVLEIIPQEGEDLYVLK
ncbi:ATP-binding protein [Litoribacter ruber]|uniref:ATP-binding protein n=1 Tax=Litoribacter ruber TaxID=702568 RepID=A0AAP2G284_9BACT|nr:MULTISPECIES: ATP-binding protein [Litoribacter]MBS9525382.1 ATP-binding protein [Litoribacter alkaliphilus]MBT0809767.1 ATP-binding protein [Litoribacter ruber]